MRSVLQRHRGEIGAQLPMRLLLKSAANFYGYL
ncbi:hypothetical protein ZEAMMB73_Zm00001d003274 [Zea mays]|uniref:Uncharacterized protein n=1 Tax=Zea mays TaxID=4577 RepID=A0A1D6E8A8_MAIZE|nr:hypothetical protein ZEAMMB73_Zm00001d003274 [Zea mays]